MFASKPQKEIHILTEGITSLNIPISDGCLEKFIIYLAELKRWNRAYNLTGLKKDEDIIIKHFIDSLLYLRFIPENNLDVCDIGSGAGFPGLPIAIVRKDLKITLIEPSGKKAIFLRHITRTLSLKNITVFESNVEDMRGIFFDVAVTRALFSIERLIKKAWHIVRQNGIFIFSKGPAGLDEVKHMPPNLELELVQVALPFTSITRNLIKIIKK